MHLSSGRKALSIGIFGSNGKTSTASLLSAIFNSAGFNVTVVNDEKNKAHKRNMTNIESYKQLKSDENNDIIIIEMDTSILMNSMLNKVDFDILIHSHISENSFENSAEGLNIINSMVNSCKEEKILILNTDDPNWKKIIIDLENTYLITYGLGNKATVTASSIECSKEIHFLYCLQRALTIDNSDILEPMEIPIVVKALGQYNVYNSIAAITAALAAGISLDNIKSSLERSILPATGIKILYENGFAVVDNVCNTVSGFESGFEAIQNLPYENISLIFNLDSKNTPDVNVKIMDMISTWSLTLKIKNIFLIEGEGCNDTSEEEYLKNLGENIKIPGINIFYIHCSPEGVEEIISALKDKDLLLFFCSSCINSIRGKITEMLDTRILGNLAGHSS